MTAAIAEFRRNSDDLLLIANLTGSVSFVLFGIYGRYFYRDYLDDKKPFFFIKVFLSNLDITFNSILLWLSRIAYLTWVIITISRWKIVVENNALGDKDKVKIYDIRPGWLKPGVLDEDGELSLGAGGVAKGGKSKDTKIWTETKKDKPVPNAYGHWEKHKSEFPEYQNAKQ